MKTIIKTIWCILVLAVSAGAANYTVKSGGGGNYSTIQACATAMSAGDTCTVYAGTYNENVTVSAGSVDNYKTLTVNPGDTVNVLGFSISDHTKVNGFHIQNTSSPTTNCVYIATSTDFYITNNIMYACGGVREDTGGPGHASHGFIQGNTLSYIDTTIGANNTGPGLTIVGDYHLIENNDISHVSDGFHFGGSHNVIRNNTMHDTLASECQVGGNGENCHIDFIECEPSYPSSYNLYEGNREINNVSANGHGFLLQADVCNGNCRTVVIRFNTFLHIGSAGIENDNQYLYVKGYNNTYADVNGGNGGLANSFIKSAFNGSDINEIFYYPGSVTNFNAIACNTGDGSTCSTFTGGHDLAWCAGTPCSIYGYNYESGNWLDDATNLLTNPLLVNYAGGDLHLQAGSPARGAGRNLTTVAARDSGSGTSLVVTDANFFQDGSGIPGVQADWIRIGGSTTVQISSINYATNTITLANGVSRSSGDPTYLYKDSNGNVVLNGANPDIGAMFDSASRSGPAPPTGLAAIVQ